MHARLAILLAFAVLTIVPLHAVAQPSPDDADDDDAPIELLQLKRVEIGWLLDELREREMSIWRGHSGSRTEHVQRWIDFLDDIVFMQDHDGTVVWHWPGADTLMVLHDAAAANAVEQMLSVEQRLRPRRPTLSAARIEVPAAKWPTLVRALGEQAGATTAARLERQVRAIDGARIAPWVTQRDRYTRKMIFGHKTGRRSQRDMRFAFDDEQRVVPAITTNALMEFGEAIGCRVFATDTDGTARIEVEFELAHLDAITVKHVYGYPVEQPAMSNHHVGAAFTARVGECRVVAAGADHNGKVTAYAIRLDDLPQLDPVIEIVAERAVHRLYEFMPRSTPRDRLFQHESLYAPAWLHLRVPPWWPEDDKRLDANDLIEEATAYADDRLDYDIDRTTFHGYRRVTLHSVDRDVPIPLDAVDPLQITLDWLRAGRLTRSVATDIVVVSIDADAFPAADGRLPAEWLEGDTARVIVNTRVLHDTLVEIPLREVDVVWSLTQPDLIGPDTTGWAVSAFPHDAGLDLMLSATHDGDGVAISLAGEWSAFTGTTELPGSAWPDTDPIEQPTITHAPLTTSWRAAPTTIESAWHVHAQPDPTDDRRVLAFFARSERLPD